MNATARKLARMIAMDGPLPIATFMALAQHDPQHGFYAARESIGARGAFVTAPEISQIFGELVGLWCGQVWRDQGSPRRPRFVELGPGRGTLMRDALRALALVPEFLAECEIVFVEGSPALEAQQRARLNDPPAPIRWVRQWDEIAHDRPLFLVANEFFDALPIRQFVATERGWCERMVALAADGGLAFALAPVSTALAVPPLRGAVEPGAVYEISRAAEALAKNIGGVIAGQGGAALLIDYGYADKGFGDTLQAVAHHARVDILHAPGESDVSAHVDFCALAGAAQSNSARVCGPIPQGDFLRALGIGTRAAKLVAENPDMMQEISCAVERLTAEQEMGALFKVMAIVPRDAPQSPGFPSC
jgi:NADH dehydrogenase [ubiquinone] 1 alpha subcomplex assembly factor 7